MTTAPQARPATTVRTAASLVAAAFLACAARPGAAQEPPRLARVSLEAGPSWDRAQVRTNDPHGYALGGGVSIGRRVALVLGAAFERYPTPGEPTFQVLATPQGPDTLRVEGGGNKNVVATLVGLRIVVPRERFEPYGEVALGAASVAHDNGRYADPATGATVYPGYRSNWSGTLAEVAVGVRSRRSQGGLDGTVALRWRLYAQWFEGSSGASFQITLGLLTR